MTYEIKSNAIMYYGMNDLHPNNIIIETILNGEIEREVMEEAINSALSRYLYFSVKLKNLEDRLVLEENRNRVKLHDKLSLDNNDGFLFCFSVTGATLKVMFSHALTDVHGFMPFMKTILADYYKVTDTVVHDLEAECVEPLSLLPEGINTGRKKETTVSAFLLPEDTNGSETYYLSLDNNVVREFVKSMGGSFTSTLSALFAKAIAEVHEIPKNQKIVCTNIIDRKPLLGCPTSHYLSMHPASYAINKELMVKPLNEIVTAIRDDLHQKMKTPGDGQNADVFVLAKQMKQFIDYLQTLPSTKQKQQMCQQIVSSRQGNSTFTVSYVGVVDFGSLNEKVSHLHIHASATPILIEACAHGDVFDITLLQSMKASGDGQNADVYFNAFTKVLRDYGLLEKGMIAGNMFFLKQ